MMPLPLPLPVSIPFLIRIPVPIFASITFVCTITTTTTTTTITTRESFLAVCIVREGDHDILDNLREQKVIRVVGHQSHVCRHERL